MTKRLLDYNPMTGLEIWHEYNEADDTTVVHYKSDAKAILDQNKRDASNAVGSMGTMVRAASIPAGVMYEWLTKYGVNFWNKDHKPAVRRLLNDPDYRYLKCRDIII